MSKRRRYLVARAVYQSHGEDFAEAQGTAFAACPEAARFTDEEGEELWAAALYLDSVSRETIVRSLKRSKITYPPEVAFDEYRLCRYLFRRWSDPTVRQAFLELGLRLDYDRLARLKRRRDLTGFHLAVDEWGGPGTLYLLRRYGMDDMIQPLLDSFTPEQAARHKALVQFGKLTLHRFLTEHEPARAPSPWEQQKLARRIRLREVQLRSMRRSLIKVGQERKELQIRLREFGRVDQPLLSALASEWAELRTQRAEAERRHTAAMAEQAARYSEAIARLRAELAAAEQDFRETLAVRRAWLQAPGG